MCGIIGIVGREPVASQMVEALKRTHCAFVIGKHIQVALTAPQIDSFMDEHLVIIEALRARDGAELGRRLMEHNARTATAVIGGLVTSAANPRGLPGRDHRAPAAAERAL